jgi:hypothetical protein
MLMLHFKSRNDLGQLPSSDPAFPVIKELVDLTITPYDTPERPYDPATEGWIVLIQEGDLVGPLTDIWDDTSLLDLDEWWEGVTLENGFYNAIFLANNEFGLVFVIPDADWLTPEVKDMLQRHLDPPLELRK